MLVGYRQGRLVLPTGSHLRCRRYSQLGMHPPMHGGGDAAAALSAARAAAAGVYPPRTSSGLHVGGHLRAGSAPGLPNGGGAPPNGGIRAGSLPPGGSSLSSYGSIGPAPGGSIGCGGGGGSHPGTPSGLSGDTTLRRASGGAYPAIGSPRCGSCFDAHPSQDDQSPSYACLSLLPWLTAAQAHILAWSWR